MPPATSICIISDVPERGRPETMVIMSSLWTGNPLQIKIPALSLQEPQGQGRGILFNLTD